MQPRQWQQQLIQLLRRRLELEGSSRDLLVFAGPGAGKTLGALLGFRAMLDQARLDHFLVFCHRTSILNQWKSAAARLGLRLEEWPCPSEQSQDADGLLVTYQGAGRQREALGARLERWGMNTCMAIADEAHPPLFEPLPQRFALTAGALIGHQQTIGCLALLRRTGPLLQPQAQTRRG